MSKNEESSDMLEIKDVYFDFDGVTKIALSRGVLKTDKSLAKEIGYSGVGFEKLKVKAPQAVAVLFAFLKANDLKLEDVVKECDSK